MMDAKSYNAAVRGKQNRAAGQIFEEIIEAACRYYRQAGVAEIEKTPEAMKPLGRSNGKGQFLACYTKKAQPDFKGTLAGGCSVVFDAKTTSTGRIQQSVVTDEQAGDLERHSRLGAVCFIFVSFDFQHYYRIPWEVWREMKSRYGRKYLKPEDIHEYEIFYRNARLDFLRGLGSIPIKA